MMAMCTRVGVPPGETTTIVEPNETEIGAIDDELPPPHPAIAHVTSPSVNAHCPRASPPNTRMGSSRKAERLSHFHKMPTLMRAWGVRFRTMHCVSGHPGWPGREGAFR